MKNYKNILESDGIKLMLGSLTIIGMAIVLTLGVISIFLIIELASKYLF